MTFDPSPSWNTLRRKRGYAGQLAHVQHAARAGGRATGNWTGASARRWSGRCRATGAERLYTHQAEAINAALAGQNVVVATSTASGKTLCFNVPVLEALARDPLARALYLYPTKALAQDQLGKWQALVKGAGDGHRQPAGRDLRRRHARRPRAAASASSARVLLTNPDMLHAGILPNHPLWAEFFRHLQVRRDRRGAHLSRRLRVAGRVRAAAAAAGVRAVPGARDQTSPSDASQARLRPSCVQHRQPAVFIATSATIANPAEHFELLTGLPRPVVSDDGSPHGPRTFALWNPPFVDRTKIGPAQRQP